MLDIEIREMRKQDYNKAIQFAIKGMHFDWYLDNKFLLNAYGKYFWYLEMNRATQIFAAYAEDKFVGVLLAEMKDEPRKHSSFLEKIYVRFVDMIQNLFFKDGAGLYDSVNKEMLAKYKENHSPDGEIIFLAADPDAKIKGIGTMLLNELTAIEKGKTIYLYTDNACTYQFYEHRGFERVGEKNVELELGNKKIPLTCLLYSKEL